MKSWLNDLLPPPETRIPVTLESACKLLLPLIACYYAFAVLMLLPNTRFIRISLLPIALWFAYHSGTRLDWAKGYPDGGNNLWNAMASCAITNIALRMISWAFKSEPFKKKPEYIGKNTGFKQRLEDVQDLLSEVRGIKWTWAGHIHIPQETRPTHSTAAFCIATLQSYIIHIITADFIQYGLQYLFSTILTRGTVFQEFLPLPERYILAGVLSLTVVFMLYCYLQSVYEFLTLQCVLLQRQDPKLWPPLFDKPWRSTSVAEFWAQRWHQTVRLTMISTGYKPGFFIAGRPGGIIGAFFVSGLFHELAVWSFGKGADTFTCTGFFVLMGVGIIMENVWTKVTGKKVGGIWGWIWTCFWMLLWGSGFVDTGARIGFLESAFIPTGWRPSHYIFGTLPTDQRML